MTQPNKFEDLNDRFTSSGTGMTQSNKFEDLNGRFANLGTGDGFYSRENMLYSKKCEQENVSIK